MFMCESVYKCHLNFLFDALKILRPCAVAQPGHLVCVCVCFDMGLTSGKYVVGVCGGT